MIVLNHIDEVAEDRREEAMGARVLEAPDCSAIRAGLPLVLALALGVPIAAAIRDGDFQGKWGETLLLRPGRGIVARRVLASSPPQALAVAMGDDRTDEDLFGGHRVARREREAVELRTRGERPLGRAVHEHADQLVALARALGKVEQQRFPTMINEVTRTFFERTAAIENAENARAMRATPARLSQWATTPIR